MTTKLNAIYTNRIGHRLQLFQYDRRAGLLNERVYAHNLTTGYDEAWSTRLFLAEHEQQFDTREEARGER